MKMAVTRPQYSARALLSEMYSVNLQQGGRRILQQIKTCALSTRRLEMTRHPKPRDMDVRLFQVQPKISSVGGGGFLRLDLKLGETRPFRSHLKCQTLVFGTTCLISFHQIIVSSDRSHDS